MPPSCAIAIAKRASVTVSIAEETSGILRAIDAVSLDSRLTVLGRTVEKIVNTWGRIPGASARAQREIEEEEREREEEGEEQDREEEEEERKDYF